MKCKECGEKIEYSNSPDYCVACCIKNNYKPLKNQIKNKGDINMDEKKTITSARVENAKKVMAFLKDELKLTYPEDRRVLSNAYGQIAKGNKK